MNIINKGISSFFQPLISYIFKYFLDDYIDCKNIDLSNLTLNGLNNLDLDVDKLNKKFLNNSFFLLEKVRVGKLRVYYSFMKKKVSLIVEDLEIMVFLNEDIYSENEQTDNRVEKEINLNQKNENFNINEENYKKMIQTFKDYLIDIEIINLQINFSSNRPTCGFEKILFKANKVLLIKSQCQENKEKSNKELFFKVDVKFSKMGLFATIDNRKEISSQSNEKKTIPILILDEEIIFNIDISMIVEEIRVVVNNRIKEIIFLLSPEVIRILLTFFLKINKFENSKLLFCENLNDFFDLLKKSNKSDLFESNFSNFFDNLNINFSSDLDQSFFIKSSQDLMQKTRIYTKINITNIHFVVYNPLEFKDIELTIKNNMVEEHYLNVFPFQNYQMCIKNIEIILKKDQVFCFIEFIKFVKLVISQNNNNSLEKSSFNLQSKIFNNSSMMLQSMIESTYEATEIFCIDSKELENDDIINDILKDQMKGRKNSMVNHNKNLTIFAEEENKVFGNNKNTLNERIENTGFLIKFKNEKLNFVFKYIFLETDNCFRFYQDIFNLIINDTKSYILKNEKNFSKNLIDLEKKLFFDNYVNFLEKENQINLEEKFKNLKKNKIMFLDSNLCMYIHIHNIQIRSEIFKELLNIRNIDIKLFPLPANKAAHKLPVVNIENFKILEKINLKNIKILIADYDKSKEFLDLQIMIDFIDIDCIIDDFFSKIDYITDNKKLVHQLVEKEKKNWNMMTFLITKLTNLFEIFPDKISLNEQLYQLWLKIVPDYIFSSNEAIQINRLSVNLNDRNSNTLNFLNNFIKKGTEKLKEFMINIEISLSEKRYTDVNILDLKIENLYLSRKNNEIYKIKFSELALKSFEFWNNDSKNFFFNTIMREMKFRNLKEGCDFLLKKIIFVINSSKKRINILMNLLEFYYNQRVLKLIDFIEKDLSLFFPEEKTSSQIKNQNLNFKKSNSNIKENLSIIEINEKESPDFFISDKNSKSMEKINHSKNSKKTRFLINEIEINLHEFILSVNLFIENIQFGPNFFFIPLLLVNKISTEKNSQILEIKNINFIKEDLKNDVKISKININLPIYYIKILIEFKFYLTSIFESGEEIFNRTFDKNQKSDFEFKSFLKKDLYEKNNGFKKISSFWEIFQSFNDLIKISNTITEEQSLNNFKKKFEINFDESFTFFLEELFLNIKDENENFKHIIIIERIFLNLSEEYNYVIITKMNFFIEKGFNKDLILNNIENDFLVKIFLKKSKNGVINFYIKLDDLNFVAESKLWETIDNQLKKIFQDFLKNKEQDKNINFDEINLKEDKKDRNNLILGECILESFDLFFKLINTTHNLPIESTNTLELTQEFITLDHFLELFLNKVVKSIKISYKFFKLGTSLKFFFYFLWRIIHFIYFKRNIYKVHRSFYLLVKDKIKCKFQ